MVSRLKAVLLALVLLGAFLAAAPAAEAKPYCTSRESNCNGHFCALTDPNDGGWWFCIPRPGPQTHSSPTLLP